jgi:hypothetical protein
MAFPLINVINSPLLPSPMQSKDSGEAWLWGDFFAVLQKEPLTIAQSMQAMTSKAVAKSPMDYPFAMTVFYNKSKNPHGPSSRPVLCVTLEQTNLAGLAAMLGGSQQIPNIDGQPAMPIMLGVFTGSGRRNLGRYNGPLSADAVRSLFFSTIRQQLGLQNEPVRIGTIESVYGHPNTGWSAAVAAQNDNGKGRLAVLCLLAAAILCVGAILLALLP